MNANDVIYGYAHAHSQWSSCQFEMIAKKHEQSKEADEEKKYTVKQEWLNYLLNLCQLQTLLACTVEMTATAKRQMNSRNWKAHNENRNSNIIYHLISDKCIAQQSVKNVGIFTRFFLLSLLLWLLIISND